MNHSKAFQQGMKNGLPIAAGYFAVSFTLGIAARNAGISAIQASLASAGCMASAGQFIGFETIALGAGLLELFLMEIIASARYVLMSCSISQKIAPSQSLIKRFFLGYCITDEIFAISMAQPGLLNPFFSYGAMFVCVPGWTAGTFLGVVLGNLLPASIVRALSVGLYGMFLAVIIPPCKTDKVILGVVCASMFLSVLFSILPGIKELSYGVRIILLTLLIASTASFLHPVETITAVEDEEEEFDLGRGEI